MPPLAGVMYTIGCVVGSFISGLSRCYGAVHDESSLMSAAADVRVWKCRDVDLTARMRTKKPISTGLYR